MADPAPAEIPAGQVVAAIQTVRKLELKKTPSISDTGLDPRAADAECDDAGSSAGRIHAEPHPQVRDRYQQGTASDWARGSGTDELRREFRSQNTE